MRLDLALRRLRFVKSRGAAQALVEEGHMRVNGQRVDKASRSIAEGDVLTIPRGKGVVVVQILTLPERRGPPAEAQSCYRTLDPVGQSVLAEDKSQEFKGNPAP